jgi:hypothetical protein
MSVTEDLAKDYRVAFLHYLSRQEEAALHRGYELGRGAFADGVSVLDLARMHHDVLLDVLRDTRADELPGAAAAASEFFLAVLSTFDLAQRAFLDRLAGAGAESGVSAPRPRPGGATDDATPDPAGSRS